MKNIAVVLWDLNITGGTQRQALNLAAELKKRGHNVDVFCYYYDIDLCYSDLCNQLNIICVTNITNQDPIKKEKKQSIKNPIMLKFARLYSVYKTLLKNIIFTEKKIYKLCSLIDKQNIKYDVINAHDYEAYKIARVLKHNNIVWTLNDIQRPKTGGKYFLHKFLFNFLRKFLIWQEIKRIKKIFVLDDRNKQLCKKHYNREAIVIRSGTDINLIKHISRSVNLEDKKYKIFLSSIFFPHRRFEDLVEAINILVNEGHKNIAVSINGINSRSYNYYLFIKNLISERELNKYFTITNGLTEKELYQKYCDSDIFVFPNHNQTWGLAVFEAMLFKNACIVSKTSGAHEILTDKKNALLVNPKSPKEIANSIKWLINNPEKMKEISEQGSKFVIKNMSWGKYAEKMERQF